MAITSLCTNAGYWGYACLLIDVSLTPGLIEHECRDVVIALKTRQAIQTVIAKALKHLTFLCSRGIIDKHEGIEMNKVTGFPQPDTQPVLWLEQSGISRGD